LKLEAGSESRSTPNAAFADGFCPLGLQASSFQLQAEHPELTP